MNGYNRKVRIVVDAMGGDYAPTEIVKGAVLAAQKQSDVDITLVGPVETITAEMARYNSHSSLVHFIGADDSIKEGESPVLTAQSRSNSSVAVAVKALRAGEADAVISAGPTGALVGSTIRYLGMIDGIERPVIGGALATFAPDTVLMDCGVNVDCKPSHLLTFAIMGTIYARKFLNIENPSIAILNIGAEENKGNRVTRETYALLKESGLNFIGNVEGNEIMSGKANVIICDGFVGNVLFKFTEGGLELINKWLKSKFGRFPLTVPIFKLISRDLTSLTRIPQSAGSGIIWGVNGVVLKMHGASRAPEVAEKIAQARLVVSLDVLNSLKTELATIGSKLKV